MALGSFKCPMCMAEYNPATESTFCPHQKMAVKVAPRKQKIRLVTTTGWWFDMDKPADFNMFIFATSIRATGFLINDALYQPQETIASIFVYNEDNPPTQQTGVVIDFPGKPPA